MASVTTLGTTQRLPALLPLKFIPPQPRDDALVRPDLQALLAEVRLRPVTLVEAPAGYGKTTLLAQWGNELAHTGSAVCWLTLDEGDRDPALQLAYLVRAFQMRFPGIGEQAWRILNSVANPQRDWPLVAGALCSDLQARLTTPTFLMLDDLHLMIEGQITGPLLGYLLRAAPPTLHIVIASRRPVSIAPLPRLRAEGALVEVSQYDLSLTAAEASAVLEQSGVQLTAEELDLLLLHTEGWALSVQLAARALARQTPDQRANFLRTLGASQSGLFDYLATEVLANLPADVLDFLALAALPGQFDAALLTEVLTQHNVDSLIARAQQLGMPLLSVEHKAQAQAHTLHRQAGVAQASVSGPMLPALRFHPLWRELLLRHAQALLDAEGWIALQRRFGRALERRGDLEAALRHYALANDSVEMARALRECAWPLVNTPQRDIIRGWLERLPSAIRTTDPELLHMWGWSQCVLAPAQATAVISAAAELYRVQNLPQRELRALSDLAALLFWEDRPSDFAAVCIRAVRAANRARDAWARGTALVSVVALLYSRGRYSAALRVARYAATHPRNPFWQWLLALIVSDISIQQGYPAVALTAIDEVLVVATIDQDDRMRQSLLRQRALALHQQGHSTEAIELALSAHHRLSEYYNDGAVGTSAAMVALLLLEQERVEEAATYLTQARAVAHRTGATALLARVQALEVYTLLRTGQMRQISAAAFDALRQLDESEQFAPSFWLRLLLLLALGESGELARATALAQSLIAQMQIRGDGLFLVIAQLYLAVLAQRGGDMATSEAALHAGWELAEAQNYSFVPILPTNVLHTVVVEALRRGLAPRITATVLRRQLPDQATTLLVGLLKDAMAATRAHVAELLGDLGSATAYAALRGLLKDRNPQVRTAAESALERLVYRPSYRLRVRMLGTFNVWRGDEEVRDRDWRSIKARQLLQLLLVEYGRTLSRERIMDMLWPGLEGDSAANNLRVTLSRLTKAIEPERPEGAPVYYIVQQADTYGFNTDSDHQIDSADFTAAVDRGQNAERKGQRDAAVAAYRQAIEIYGGAFLPDSLYEDWSVVERERLALLFNKAALRLGALLLEDGLTHEAIGLAWRVIEYDQAQEEAYQLLMRAHASLGERSTALRLYARCVAALQAELGVEPLPDTVLLYEALRGTEEVSQ